MIMKVQTKVSALGWQRRKPLIHVVDAVDRVGVSREDGGLVKAWSRFYSGGIGLAAADINVTVAPRERAWPPRTQADEGRIRGAPDALRAARAELERVRTSAQDLERQRNVALAEAERWRLEHREALRTCDELDARRDALIEALPFAMSDRLLVARSAAWDEGWRAAKEGFIDHHNPYRAAASMPRPVPAE